MGFLENAKDKIEDLLDGHKDDAADGIDKVADVADDKTGGKFSDQIDAGADKAADALDSLGSPDAPPAAEAAPAPPVTPATTAAPADPAAPAAP